MVFAVLINFNITLFHYVLFGLLICAYHDLSLQKHRTSSRLVQYNSRTCGNGRFPGRASLKDLKDFRLGPVKIN